MMMRQLSITGLCSHVLRHVRERSAIRGRQCRMKVLEQLPLPGRRNLLLISIDNREYLIGGSMDQITSIVALSAANEGDRL